MNDDRTKKRPDQDRHDQEARGALRERHEGENERARKPDPVEEREWRGSGVCGDQHTD